MDILLYISYITPQCSRHLIMYSPIYTRQSINVTPDCLSIGRVSIYKDTLSIEMNYSNF